jgi:GNAT superfamily N-acetyltransferase
MNKYAEICKDVLLDLLKRIKESEDDIFGRVAYCEDDLIGFIFGDMRRIWFREPDSAWLIMLFVAPERRRRGVGRRLLAEFLEQARELGFRKIYVHESINPDIISFLEKMGFKRKYIHLEKQI